MVDRMDRALKGEEAENKRERKRRHFSPPLHDPAESEGGQEEERDGGERWVGPTRDCVRD